MKRRSFLVGAASFVALPARAQEAVANARALSGDRFVAGDEEFQLADVIAPPLYRLEKDTPAYFEASRRALENILSAGVSVEDAGQKTRWGARLVKAVALNTQQSVQEKLCKSGAARVAPQTDDHEFIDRLLIAEKAARGAKEGLWSHSAYRVFDAQFARGAIGAYHLIEGVVRKASKTRARLYLNFGADYRDDFTAGATSRIYRRWASDGFDLAGLEGARVRIRGFVEEINGPSVDLLHPKQVEALGN